MNGFNFTKRFNLIIVILSLFILSFVGFAFSVNRAYADETPSAELYLPATDIEYKKLTSPIGAYCSDNVTALIENNDTYRSITITTADFTWENEDKTTGNYSGVKRLDEKTLLYADTSKLYKVDLSAAAFTPELVSITNDIGVSSFDVYGDLLVTSNNNLVAVYKSNGDTYEKIKDFQSLSDSPVAINSLGQVFYLDNEGKVCLLNAHNIEDATKKYHSVTGVANLIADSNYFYYVVENQPVVYRVSIADGKIDEITCTDTFKDYDLGKIVAPVDISFSDGNLIITDNALNAVQKFKIEEDKLIFTGYAIASDKTAYNRIAKSASNIEKYGDKIAVLDNNKLSVITTGKVGIYNTDNYKNYLKSQFNGTMPTSFALGKDSILLSYGDGTSSSKLKSLSLTNDEIKDIDSLFTGNIIRDICYQSGYYYALADDGNKPANVFVASEDDFLFKKLCQVKDSTYNFIAVDSLHNVYLSTSTQVIKLSPVDNYVEKNILSSTMTDVSKMDTDLSGTLYVLDKNVLKYYDGVEFKTLTLNAPSDIKSFAMDFMTKSVYFIYENSEVISVSNNLNNITLSELSVPDSYILKAPDADIDNLKIYNAIPDANVYKIKVNGDKFDYLSICHSNEDYAYICTVSFTNSTGKTLSMYAMAGQNEVVLMEQTQVKNVTDEVLNKTSAPSKAYVTTDVNGYYIPVITQEYSYILFDEESIRLSKLSEIRPISTISFLGIDYYYAEFDVNNKTHTGYVPKSFTVEVLSEDFNWNEFTVEKVFATSIYSDNELKDSIMELPKNSEVIVIEQDETFSKVAFKDDEGNYTIGYIANSAIKNEPKKAITNIVIIVVVFACLLPTVAYFVAKKKF